MADDLGEFEGAPVLSTSVAITSAGDGLSQALAIEPLLMHKDETVYVLLECAVGDIVHQPVKNTNGWQRKHKLKAGVATIVDAKDIPAVLEAINAQRDRNLKAIEERKGIQRLGIDLLDDHEKGNHFLDPVAECPVCQNNDVTLDGSVTVDDPTETLADGGTPEGGDDLAAHRAKKTTAKKAPAKSTKKAPAKK